ncbi:copper resistance CopC family protein [Actinotalea sp. K2]|uniref:copper resistance CopC family protein n=1 Tax=Actinotalea sp. K2 TaxID=2939438 RepID=UPI0020179A69|nr:copper resistance CopC family protein [Actinotalea sp. K2]MCL3860569.1 copper resistance protein CopC [Actinotalea sp. K2]
MRQRPAGGRRPLRLLWSVLVGASALIIVLAGPSAAHDVLESSVPAAGAVLTEQPTQVLLTYSAQQLDLGAGVQVTGADGAGWADGDVVIADRTLTQPLREGMPAGVYTVQWRSVSSDGHAIDGDFTFTLDLPAPTVEEPAPTPETQAGTDAQAPAPTQEPEQETISPVVPGTPDGPSTMSPLLVVGLVLGASAAAVTVLVLLRRKGER